MNFTQNQISVALDSIIFDTDSYKWSHYAQYPEGTEYVWDYISSRGGQYVTTTFFGLQMFIKKYLCGKVVTQEAIEVADAFAKQHGEPFNREGWQYILDVHGGKLPLRIRAVREGAHIPYKNVLVSLVNTDPNCGWLPSFVEPSILRGVWYPTTVATRSRFIKEVILKYLINTSDDTSGIDFKLHDFGARGASSKETSGIGGAAHMVNFKGSDTIVGILTAMKYYPEKDGTSPVIGFSIPASEHSSMTILGPDGELEQMRRMVSQFGAKFALMACVSDGYDIYQACHKWGSLKDEIVASGSIVVVRPDSGDPVDVTVKCFQILDKYFGHTVNSKGFKVLNNVRVIYGDGINELTINSILLKMEWSRWSADNIAFGMGGELLQTPNRDTNKWAMKASAACINGEWRDVFKDPVTDPGKKSFKGQMSLYRNRDTGEYATIRVGQGYDVKPEWEDQMVDVFYNGELLVEYSLQEIRDFADSNQ